MVMDIFIVLLLLAAGCILVLAELFLLPGVTFAGILGIGSLGFAVYEAYTLLGMLAGHITLFATLLVLVLGVYWFLKSRTLDKMALKTNINAKVDLLAKSDVKVGDVGMTVSRLAPMGKANINGRNMEAKSEAAFIDENREVVVTAIEGNRVIVRLSETTTTL